MEEALFYEKFTPLNSASGAPSPKAKVFNGVKNNSVRCRLCHHFCVIAPDKFGICQVRKNIGGILYSTNYGKIIASHLDPIEKKPLYRFLPGTLTYSIACAGCNFKCLHCQNADISQIGDKLLKINDSLAESTPEEIIMAAEANGCPSVSYTYTEPTIFAEFALDCMKLAKDKGLKNIWVSNGYMSSECLSAIVPYLDAANIDLKFFKDESYLKICGARLQPVLDNLIWLKNHGVHLEVTTLIIPTINDGDEELKSIAEFIFKKLGADTAWHVSAFYPTYKLADLPPTPRETIYRAQAIGKKAGLKYVYVGNV
ncbi:MAG: AmmeMemoRadiSam system radical SAM enzyme [Patescibacteria group bacterium]